MLAEINTLSDDGRVLPKLLLVAPVLLALDLAPVVTFIQRLKLRLHHSLALSLDVALPLYALKLKFVYALFPGRLGPVTVLEGNSRVVRNHRSNAALFPFPALDGRVFTLDSILGVGRLVALRAKHINFGLEFYTVPNIFQVLVIVANATDHLLISGINLLSKHFLGFLLNIREFQLVIGNSIPVERVYLLDSLLFLFKLLLVVFNRILGYGMSLSEEGTLPGGGVVALVEPAVLHRVSDSHARLNVRQSVVGQVGGVPLHVPIVAT